MKQRVVDNFDGDDLNERWSKGATTGSHDGFMQDGKDKGYFIKSTDSLAGALALINFNSKRQYNHAGCVCIATVQPHADSTCVVGFDNIAFANSLRAQGRTSTFTNWFIRSDDGGGMSSDTEGSVVFDTTKRNFKVELLVASGVMTIDGVLDVTHTTDLPTAKQQPEIAGGADTTGTDRGMNILYFEAFNK